MPAPTSSPPPAAELAILSLGAQPVGPTRAGEAGRRRGNNKKQKPKISFLTNSCTPSFFFHAHGVRTCACFMRPLPWRAFPPHPPSPTCTHGHRPFFASLGPSPQHCTHTQTVHTCWRGRRACPPRAPTPQLLYFKETRALLLLCCPFFFGGVVAGGAPAP